jgi:hypothetical protein
MGNASLNANVEMAASRARATASLNVVKVPELPTATRCSNEWLTVGAGVVG